LETSLERIDDHTVRITVTVPAEEVDKAIDQAYKRVANKIKVPGFRAGKAPKPVIDTHIGREAVVADAQDEVLTDSYSRALDEQGLRPIEQPEIDDLETMEAGKPFEYSAEIQVRPELTISSLEGLQIELPPGEASGREVDAQIDHLRERYATLEPVEDRGVAEDDFVLLSFVGKIAGEDYEGNVVDKYLYEMGRALMPEEFEEALVGAKPGDEVHAEYTIPDTSANPDYIGKIATFDITVHEIKAKVLPELDDEFAMNAGGYDSLEEMRTATKEQLDRSKAMGRARARELEARKSLAARLEGEVPEQMVETAREQIKRDFVSGLEAREMNIEQYMEVTGYGIDQIDADIAKQAEDSVREELALEALFRHLGYEITDDDIDEAIREMAGAAEADPQELREKWEAAGVMSVLTEQIMHKRAIGWLMDEANVGIIEKDDTEADDAEPAEDTAEPAEAIEPAESAAEEESGEPAQAAADEEE